MQKVHNSLMVSLVNDWLAGKTPPIAPTDPSNRYTVPAIITELAHNRPDVIKKTITPPDGSGMTTYLFPEPVLDGDQTSYTVGYFQAQSNTLLFENEALWYNMSKENDKFSNVGLHEYIHAIDAEGSLSKEKLDGILPNLTQGETTLF